MRRHPFDPLSAALGVLAIALGVLVVSGEAGSFDARGVWWIAIAGLIVGLAIIPWRRRPPADDVPTTTTEAQASEA